MSIAILVQNKSTVVDGVEQTIVVPDYISGCIKAFHRVSTGSRGRGNPWVVTDIDSLPTTTVLDAPIACRVMDGDEFDVSTNKITSLAVKLQKAFGDRTARVEWALDSHQEVVARIIERMTDCDQTLVRDYINDARLSNTLQIRPLVVQSVARISTPTAPAKNPAAVGSSFSYAVVPDSSVHKSYITRKCGGIDLFDIYSNAMKRGRNVLLTGDAGSGKTMSAMAYASKMQLPFYSVSCSMGTDTKKMFGGFNPTDDAHFGWVDGAITQLFRTGGVILLDEINMMQERMASELHSALDDRRQIELTDKDGEVIKAHPNLLIIGAQNPNYRGTRPLNQAFNDRFADQLDFPYDSSIERKLIRNRGVLELAKLLRNRFDAEELNTPISTRGLCQFMESLESFNLDYAIYTFINKFPTHERDAIRLAFDTVKTNIERDMTVQPIDVDTTTHETIAESTPVDFAMNA